MVTSSNTSRRRVTILAVVTALYVLCFLLLAPVIGVSVLFLIAIPTALAGWLYGMRASVVAWVVAVVSANLLIRQVAPSLLDVLSPVEQISGQFVILFYALVLGYVHRLEIKLRAELEKRRALEAIEQRRSAELEAVYRASFHLTANLDLVLVLKTILEQVSALVEPERIYLFLYDGEKLTFGTHFSQIGEQQPNRELRPNGLTYTVARSGQRIVVPDISQHPLYTDQSWQGAIVGLPLAIGDRVYGVMNVSYDQPHTFADDELRVLDVLATQAAIALRNAGTYENTRSYAATLEGQVAERTAALSSEKGRAEAILNNSFAAILLLSANGVIQQVNPAYKRMFEHDQGIGRELAMLFSDRQAIRDAVRAVVTSHSNVELEATVEREQGNLMTDIVLVPFEGSSDSEVILCTIRNATERRLAELRQRQLTEGLRKVLSLTSHFISAPDIDSMWKQAVETARSELELERCGIFVESEGYMRGTFGTDRHGNTVDERDQRWLKASWWADRQYMFSMDAPLWDVAVEDQLEWVDGHVAMVDHGWIVITPIHSAYRFIGVMVNDTAITKAPLDEIKQEVLAVFCSFLGSLYEHKRVEDEMRRALEREKELNELKSRFTSMISHELRTPLASIQLASDLLLRYYDRQTDETRQTHLHKIQGQVKHMTDMIEDVLVYAHAEQLGLQLQPKVLDLYALCTEVITETRLMHPNHKLEFEASTAENWTGELDPKLMRQAITNLLLNAVKYSDPGSTIRLSLERDQQDLILQVIDHGIGIPEEDRARVFDVFYRAKNAGNVSGTGLGLTLVRQIAEAHNGVIFCESEVGVGTTFSLRIPCFNAS